MAVALPLGCSVCVTHILVVVDRWWTTPCVVRRTYGNFGDRCFAVGGTRLWNSFPVSLGRTDIGYEQFKCLLKSRLISLAFVTVFVRNVPLEIILTYLLTHGLHGLLCTNS